MQMKYIVGFTLTDKPGDHRYSFESEYKPGSQEFDTEANRIWTTYQGVRPGAEFAYIKNKYEQEVIWKPQECLDGQEG